MDEDDSKGPTMTVDPAGPHAETGEAPTPGPRTLSQMGERYTLGGAIAKGGMGEVLTALDKQIGRHVAVKRMKEFRFSITPKDACAIH